MPDNTQTDAGAEDNLAGVPEGTVIETEQGQPNEKIVYDRDADGNVTGWHKEAA